MIKSLLSILRFLNRKGDLQNHQSENKQWITNYELSEYEEDLLNGKFNSNPDLMHN